MKKTFTRFGYLLCTIFISISAITSLAQMVLIPDVNFRTKLINLGYGSCITGDSINSACPLVANATNLNVSNANISNLQGIQAFGS